MWILRVIGWSFAVALLVVAIWIAYDSSLREAGETATNRGVVICIIMVFGFMLYFLPTIIAQARGHVNWPAIGALNAFLGWTALGWIVALVWSLTSGKPHTVVVYRDRE